MLAENCVFISFPILVDFKSPSKPVFWKHVDQEDLLQSIYDKSIERVEDPVKEMWMPGVFAICVSANPFCIQLGARRHLLSEVRNKAAVFGGGLMAIMPCT